MLKFNSGEEMLSFVVNGNDIYCPSEGQYVFVYNDRGAVCEYSGIDRKRALALQKAAIEHDDNWSAFLGGGGKIFDAKPEEGKEVQLNIDYCEDVFDRDWILTNNVCDYYARRYVTDIAWEDDGEDVELPKVVEIPSELDDDEIADYLSDQYSYLVKGFSIRDEM